MARLSRKQKDENLMRAERGSTMLEHYARHHLNVWVEDEGYETVLTDLLADLRHFAKANPDVADYGSADFRAEGHFEAEITGAY